MELGRCYPRGEVLKLGGSVEAQSVSVEKLSADPGCETLVLFNSLEVCACVSIH